MSLVFYPMIFNKMPSMINMEVMVYQFGKVGSSSIVASLKEQNICACQTHVLGLKSLSQVLNKMLSPNVTEWGWNHYYGQFIQNLKLTKKLLDYQQKRIAGGKLKIITLGRHPSDWFFSEFLQNIEDKYRLVDKFCDQYNERKDLPDSLKFEKYFNKAYQLLGDNLIKNGIEGDPLRNINKNDLLFQAQASLIMPILWFKNQFQPALGVDIFQQKINERGNVCIELSGMDIMVIRYESLEKSVPDIAGFLGFENFFLKKENISETKPYFNEVKDARKSIIIPDIVKEYILNSQYSKFFEYKTL